ncbi:MAG TPA: XdhC family protein [Stellaceae bacterium]|nr:XdhC family protein [Stellaceae bacterium]
MKTRHIDAVLAASKAGRTVALATELKSGAQLLIGSEMHEGDLALDGAALAAARAALRSGRNTTLETPAGRVFVQVFSPPRRCFVVGAVHIAQPLVPMLIACDYQPIVIDPRGAWATEARFPGVELSTEWPDEAMARLKPDGASAIVALTHDPKIDDPALAAALRSDAFYIGALGSRRNHERRLQRLAAEHGFSADDLARIHGPIGLNIGAVSQAEIAVSIVAEITQVLHRASDKDAIKAAAE